MKKVLLILVSLIAVSLVYGFENGDIMLGGVAAMEVHKSSPNADPTLTLLFTPQMGYFISRNLCTDVYLAVEGQADEDESITGAALGFGARLFVSSVYAGAGMQTQTITYNWDESYLEDVSVSSNFIYFKAGLMAPLSKSVYLDMYGNYLAGIGDFGGDGSGKNEQSRFTLFAGIQCMLHR